MPSADFIPDNLLDEEVRCEKCDETLVKMFKNDHKCDEQKLNKMIKNRQGELADPFLVAKP